MKTESRNGVLYATRNIILGKNVRNYPKASLNKSKSDLATGSILHPLLEN